MGFIPHHSGNIAVAIKPREPPNIERGSGVTPSDQATVDNIDRPSRQGLSTAEQQREIQER